MAHSHSVKDYPGQLMGAMAFSAVIGALSAMLFTPRRGNEMRWGIKSRGMRLRDRMMQAKDSASDTAVDAMDHMEDTADKAKTRAKTTISKAKDDADEIRRNGEP